MNGDRVYITCPGCGQRVVVFDDATCIMVERDDPYRRMLGRILKHILDSRGGVFGKDETADEFVIRMFNELDGETMNCWKWYSTGATIPADEVGAVTVIAHKDGWFLAENFYGTITVRYHP